MAEGKSKLLGVASVVDPIKEILSDALEVIADDQLQEGVLKELPGVGILFKTYKAVGGIKDLIFFRKLDRFLTELETISLEDKTKFWAKNDESEEEKQKFGEQLIIYLERHDTIDKAILLARAFKAYIKGEIQKSDFLDLAMFIDSLYIHHLKTITSILIMAGSSGSFRNIAQMDLEWKEFLPELEIRRLLNYKDNIEAVEGRYELLEKTSMKLTREHGITLLAQYFLDYVIPGLTKEVTDKLKENHIVLSLVRRR